MMVLRNKMLHSDVENVQMLLGGPRKGNPRSA